ncbi:hypothetical protein GCM10010340_69200 [Streptomyces griseoloalbus]|nr:hypothetical protein GCM10010340_69200 [Streptomyces albaduncus]
MVERLRRHRGRAVGDTSKEGKGSPDRYRPLYGRKRAGMALGPVPGVEQAGYGAQGRVRSRADQGSVED